MASRSQRRSGGFGSVSKPAVSALLGLTLAVGAALGVSGRSSATPNASPTRSMSATTTPATDFAKVFQVDGHGVYVQCTGSGSPTIMLISGAGVSSESWDYVGDTADTAHPPEKSPNAVEPQLARDTRVCTYDRPGTTGFDDSPSRSSPVAQPTTAQGDARYLRAALGVAGVAPPYIFVAHSWGGFIATTYDRLYRSQVLGMVLIDPGSQYLKTVLRPQVWNTWMRAIATNGSKNPTAEQPDYPASVAFLRGLPPAKRVPTVVLTSDKPIDFLGNGSAAKFQPQWVQAQTMLARSLGGKQITKTKSGHFVQSENPALVIAQTKAMLTAAKVRNQNRG